MSKTTRTFLILVCLAFVSSEAHSGRGSNRRGGGGRGGPAAAAVSPKPEKPPATPTRTDVHAEHRSPGSQTAPKSFFDRFRELKKGDNPNTFLSRIMEHPDLLFVKDDHDKFPPAYTDEIFSREFYQKLIESFSKKNKYREKFFRQIAPIFAGKLMKATLENHKTLQRLIFLVDELFKTYKLARHDFSTPEEHAPNPQTGAGAPAGSEESERETSLTTHQPHTPNTFRDFFISSYQNDDGAITNASQGFILWAHVGGNVFDTDLMRALIEKENSMGITTSLPLALRAVHIMNRSLNEIKESEQKTDTQRAVLDALGGKSYGIQKRTMTAEEFNLTFEALCNVVSDLTIKDIRSRIVSEQETRSWAKEHQRCIFLCALAAKATIDGIYMNQRIKIIAGWSSFDEDEVTSTFETLEQRFNQTGLLTRGKRDAEDAEEAAAAE
jgi:hypothetical protein